MRHFIVKAVLGGLLLSSACQTVDDSSWGPDPAPVATRGTEHAGGPASAVTATSEAGESLPVFVEVTQRTTMGGPGAQQPPLQVGVAEFHFSEDSGVLQVQPPILEGSLAADVLIGVSTILLTPGQSYENRELVQFPAGQPALLRILESDAETGAVRLVYQREPYDLPPGKRLEFTQAGAGAGKPVVTTAIVNHGRLSAIQLAPPDGSVR